jgi:hypothetical protein
MKKMWLFSPFILSLLASPLFGEDLLMGESIDKSEIAKGYIIGQSQKKLRNSKDKNCTSCCSPMMDYRLPADFNGWNSFAEVLVWQVQEQGSEFVATPNAHSAIDVNVNQTQLLGDIQSLSFDWNGGLRLGLGYTFVRDSWQVLGQYTWFATSGSNTFSAAFPTSATTEWLMPTFTDIEGSGLLNASSSSHFSFQMADLLMARRFLVKDQIQLNFSLGATGGYIKENSHVTYENVGMSSYVANRWGFGGGGLRTGIDGNWHIGYGFGCFGKFSFAAILGQYGNNNRITADSPGLDGSGNLASPKIANTEYSGIFLLPTTQITLGFDWCQSYTNCWISGVRVAVAGEFNNLSNLQQVFKNPTETTSPTYFGKLYVRDVGSVYMYGANVRLGADF